MGKKIIFLSLAILSCIGAMGQEMDFRVIAQANEVKDAFEGGKINYEIWIENTADRAIDSLIVSSKKLAIDKYKIKMPFTIEKGQKKRISGSYQYVLNPEDLQRESVSADFKVEVVYGEKDQEKQHLERQTIVETMVESLKAVDDEFFVSGVYGTKGRLNVLANDKIFGPLPPNNEDENEKNNVEVKTISTPDAKIEIDKNGYLNVEEGATAGEFIVQYQICYNSPTIKCKSAKVVVYVGKIEVKQSYVMPKKIAQGEKISFTFTVVNQGKEPVSELRLTNQAIEMDRTPVKDQNFDFVTIESQQAKSYTKQYKITKEDLDRGYIKSDITATCIGVKSGVNLIAQNKEIVVLYGITAKDDQIREIEIQDRLEISGEEFLKNDYFDHNAIPVDINKKTPSETDDILVEKISLTLNGTEVGEEDVRMDARGNLRFKNISQGEYVLKYKICGKNTEGQICAEAKTIIPIVRSAVAVRANAVQPKEIIYGNQIEFVYRVINQGTSTIEKIVFLGDNIVKDIKPKQEYIIRKKHTITKEEADKKQIVNREDIYIKTTSGQEIRTKTDAIVVIPLPPEVEIPQKKTIKMTPAQKKIQKTSAK